jgi:CRP-like cAMP-binding protein
VTARDDVLSLTIAEREHVLEPGEVLFGQGVGDTTSIAVLVDGRLRVELDGAVLSEIAVPGAFVGEISALLGTARTASVVAETRSTVRIVGDPSGFFETNPLLALELSRQLAGRLQRLLAYLSDVRSQYSDVDGQLSVVDSVLGRLASRPAVDIDPGSDRAADYDG